MNHYSNRLVRNCSLITYSLISSIYTNWLVKLAIYAYQSAVGSLIHPSIHMPVHCPFKPLCNHQGEVWSVIQPYVQLNHFGYSWSLNSTTCSLNCSMLYSFYHIDIKICLYFCQSIKMSLLCRHMLISHDFIIVIVHAICSFIS